MRIAIMGAGGVGGYYGARLAAAGEEVHLIARGAHLAAIREGGLHLDSHDGAVCARPASATDDAAEVGPVDLVIFAVKLWDTEEAALACRPLIGPGTAVISGQNGITAEDMLARILDPEHVMGGVSFIFAAIEAPGRIRQTGPSHTLIFGEMDGTRSPRAEAIASVCRRAGLDHELSTEIEREMWKKFVYLVGLSGMTALTRSPVGAVRADPDTRALLSAAMAETAAVGRVRGAPVPDDVVESRMAVADSLPPDSRSSMLNDLERGNRLELPWLGGTVARLGAELGVETPVNRFVAAALALHVMGRPG
jgi:2-dehydropantoate 2-reductase